MAGSELKPAHDGDSARASEHEVCVHYESCGACTGLTVPYDEQLRAKHERVQAVFALYPLLERLEVQSTRGAVPICGYRTRAKLVVAADGALGLFARGADHTVVDIPRCRLLTHAIAEAADGVRRIYRAKIADLEPGQVLVAVDLREVVDGDCARVLMTLILAADRVPDRDSLVDTAELILREIPVVCAVACSFRPAKGPRILGHEIVRLAGNPSARDRIGRVYHYATCGAFVQVHRQQARCLHEMLIDQIRVTVGSLDRCRVLELCGGSGAIGLELAHAGARVDMVESFAPAVEAALRAAQEQGLAERFCAAAGDAHEVGNPWIQQGRRYDVVVANPPRRGLSPVTREMIVRAGPRGIGIVSCDPHTLARDIDHLRRLGYAPQRIVPIDMIPLTEEVETLAWLSPAPTVPPPVLYSDDEVVAVDKAPYEPTTPQGEYLSSLLDRARLLGTRQPLVPVGRLDVGASGVCVLAYSAAVARRWAGALSSPAAHIIHVVACRGITAAKGTITRELREQGKLLFGRTRYRRLAVFAGHSVLRVVAEQAHPHQIRRHLALIGHPVLGDDRYGHGPTNRFFEQKHGLDRTFQHCVRVEISHPGTGNRLAIESTLPGDLRTVLHRSGGPSTLLFLAGKHALGTQGFSSAPPSSVPLCGGLPDPGREAKASDDVGGDERGDEEAE